MNNRNAIRALLVLSLGGMVLPASAMEAGRNNNNQAQAPRRAVRQFTADEVIKMDMFRFRTLFEGGYLSAHSFSQTEYDNLRRRRNERTVAEKLAILDNNRPLVDITNDDEVVPPNFDTLRRDFIAIDEETGETEFNVIGGVPTFWGIYKTLKRQNWPLKLMVKEAVDLMPVAYVILSSDSSVETLEALANDLGNSATIAEITQRVQERIRQLTAVISKKAEVSQKDGKLAQFMNKIKGKISKLGAKQRKQYKFARIFVKLGRLIERTSKDVKKSALGNQESKTSKLILNAVDNMFDVIEELYSLYALDNNADALRQRLEDISDIDGFVNLFTKRVRVYLKAIAKDARQRAGLPPIADDADDNNNNGNKNSNNNGGKSSKEETAESKKDKAKNGSSNNAPKKTSTEGLMDALLTAFTSNGIDVKYDRLEALVKAYPTSGSRTHQDYVDVCLARAFNNNNRL